MIWTNVMLLTIIFSLSVVFPIVLMVVTGNGAFSFVLYVTLPGGIIIGIISFIILNILNVTRRRYTENLIIIALFMLGTSYCFLNNSYKILLDN